jgi:hypothetical protein
LSEKTLSIDSREREREREEIYTIERGQNWIFILGKNDLVQLEGQLHLAAKQIINFRCSFPKHYLPLIQEKLTINQFPLTGIDFEKPVLFTFLGLFL